MKLSRNLAIKILFVFDNLLPPILRDTRWFMFPLVWYVYRDKAPLFFHFKERAFELTETEYTNAYKEMQPRFIERETDLHSTSVKEILENVKGETVLEVGSGKGFLAGKLSGRFKVTATDILEQKELREKYPSIHFVRANIEHLPFKDREFDTVVCTHVLEHVQHLALAIQELRRVTKQRLIIVVPRQRPYRYTFDVHVHFFPYVYSFLAVMGNKDGKCRDMGGDLFYLEDRTGN